MADRLLFIGWNRPVVGREQQAMKLFQKAAEFYGKLQADGRIESFEPVLLSSHGGDLNGFFLLRGEAEKIAELQRDETFIDISIEAGFCLEGAGAVLGFIGEGVTDIFSRWSKLLGGQ
jgi:hypothetical protein